MPAKTIGAVTPFKKVFKRTISGCPHVVASPLKIAATATESSARVVPVAPN